MAARSIAVLPFENMSGDPEQEYFADGMVEEIITALSRFKWLFVIARNSSFTFRGQAIDVKEVGRGLGVRYVLEGSVRKASGKVRFTGQLIDAVTGAHIWADRFERDLTDVFALQDDVTVAVVSAVEPKLRQTEIAMAARRRPENLTAYDLYLRAMQAVLPSDPRRRGRDDQAGSDPILHRVFVGMGMALIELCRFDEAIVAGKKAFRQNPSYSPAYRCLASAFAHLGRDAEAREAAARVLEVDPTFTISSYIARGGGRAR